MIARRRSVIVLIVVNSLRGLILHSDMQGALMMEIEAA